MRVLMVSKACVVGTYQKKLEELAHLPDIELTVVVPPHWRDPAGLLRLERQHTSGYELVVEPLWLNGSYHLHFYPGLGRQMQRLRPDLVHIDEEPYNLATAHILWLARRVGAKSLFFSWQNILRQYPLPFRSIERYVLNHTDYGLVGNQESVAVWRAKGYTGPLIVIPQFGVDPDSYSPHAPVGTALVSARDGASPFTIGYVGRLVEEKGVDVLLMALTGLEGDWQAKICGSGPARPALHSLVQRLRLAGRVSFIDWTPSAQMPGLYRQFDVLVLPSRTRQNWKEQFGRALVEAMACGVPVIGSSSGEIPHVVADAGLIFPEGQPDALREQLARLMQETALRADLSRRGRERVLAHYTHAQVAARTYLVYQEMLRS